MREGLLTRPRVASMGPTLTRLPGWLDRAVRRIRHRILRHYMAIRVQRVARGFMERLVRQIEGWMAMAAWRPPPTPRLIDDGSVIITTQVVKRRRERRYRVTVMAPSAIRIQAHVRGFLQRKAVREGGREGQLTALEAAAYLIVRMGG